MSRGLVAGSLPAWAKRAIRRAARGAARIRHTRAWPAVRPAYRLARRVPGADRLLDRLLGRPTAAERAARARWQAAREVDLLRRRLLNLGLTDRALADLRALVVDAPDGDRKRLAAWELARWHADQYREEGARAALPYLAEAARGEPDPTRRRQLAVIEAECRQRLGDPAARQTLSRALAEGPDPNLFLAAANLTADPGRRVGWLNRVFAYHGLSGVALAAAPGDPDGAEVFDRLTPAIRPDPASGPDGPGPDGPGPDGPVVSVIVPAYNAAGVISTALDSLLAQTWPHLEVLVVDDGSTDTTAAVVAGYAERDPRVRLIRPAEHAGEAGEAERAGAAGNQGTYVARNHALREAIGELVTCHDADDWSHPEKLARQVRHLQANPAVVANTSEQARATSDLRFHRRGKPGYFVFPNLSSLMFRRAEVMARLGYWDSVRFGADAELQRRIARTFGDGAVVDLATGPLCLQRQSRDSLTGNEAFGYHGYFMGARKDYFETYTYFHPHRAAPGDADALRYEFPQRSRPFPVPAPLLPRRPLADRRRHFDVVIASDFRLVGGSTVSSIEEILAQRRMGLRTGLVQMAYYEADPRRSVAPKVRDVVDGDRVQMLVHGEKIHCDLLIVRYPPVLGEWHRFLPDVAPEQVRVVVNQPPMSHYGPGAEQRYVIARCHEHVQKYFGQPGVWHPIGPLVRRALHEHHGDELSVITLADEDWVNIIDVDAWRRPARPPSGPRVRIGRHSRDHEVKWPATAADLLACYPDAPGYEIHVLGGGKAPERVLGSLPANWRVRRFGEVPPREFLAELDVFVYVTHPAWVESFGRVVLEAMATGVPAVLPPGYRALFGDAASYAEPAGVRACVDRLMTDGDYYQAQVARAHRFVEQRFGYSRHAERLRGLVPRHGPGTGGGPGSDRDDDENRDGGDDRDDRDW